MRPANTALHRCLVDPSAPLCGTEFGDWTCTLVPHRLGTRHEAGRRDGDRCYVVGSWPAEKGDRREVPCDVEGFSIVEVVVAGTVTDFHVASPEGRVVTVVETLDQALEHAQQERVGIDSEDEQFAALQARLVAAAVARRRPLNLHEQDLHDAEQESRGAAQLDREAFEREVA